MSMDDNNKWAKGGAPLTGWLNRHLAVPPGQVGVAAGADGAVRVLPAGTAYAVWTGIGAAGTFAVGILFYGDAVSAGRLVSVGLIVAGIVGLKLAHGAG